MSKSPLKDVDISKLYIITRPTKLSDLRVEDFEEETDQSWKDKARKLKIRRWHQIKNQLA